AAVAGSDAVVRQRAGVVAVALSARAARVGEAAEPGRLARAGRATADAVGVAGTHEVAVRLHAATRACDREGDEQRAHQNRPLHVTVAPPGAGATPTPSPPRSWSTMWMTPPATSPTPATPRMIAR